MAVLFLRNFGCFFDFKLFLGHFGPAWVPLWVPVEVFGEPWALQWAHFSTPDSPQRQETKVGEKSPACRVPRWKRTGQLKPIITIEPEGLNAFTADGEWEEIELTVDSGATESVAPDRMPSSVPASVGAASRRGVQYEVANGERIANEGQKIRRVDGRR